MFIAGLPIHPEPVHPHQVQEVHVEDLQIGERSRFIEGL